MEHLPTKGGLTVHGILSAGGGYHPTGAMHDVTGVPTFYPDVVKPAVMVPHDYGLALNSTGVPVKKPHKVSRYVSFQQTKRAPGVFPTTIGDSGAAGLGIDSYHEFKPAEDLKDAMALAMKQQEQADMPHQWVKPEHMIYTGDKTNESTRDYFQNVAQDFQRAKIEKLMAEGFGEEEIKKVLDKERESAIAKALKNPSNPAALMEAELAKSLPDYLQPDYPIKIAPGDVPLKKDASFYQLATGQMTAVQKNKKARRTKAQLAEAKQMAMEDKDSAKLQKHLSATERKGMTPTVLPVPTGSYVLDMLRKGGSLRTSSEDPGLVTFD